MSVTNLKFIGHCGNFIIETRDKTKPSTLPKNNRNLYNNMFSFQGALADISDMPTIEGTFSALLTGSHNVKVLTFGLDGIFSAQKAFPLSELESLSIFKYLDLSSAMSGLKLPKLLSLPSSTNRLR